MPRLLRHRASVVWSPSVRDVSITWASSRTCGGDPRKFLFDFQPAGVQFNPNDPARLKAEYQYADHDFNGDGVIDSTDADIEAIVDLWRREPPDTSWTKVGGLAPP